MSRLTHHLSRSSGFLPLLLLFRALLRLLMTFLTRLFVILGFWLLLLLLLLLLFFLPVFLTHLFAVLGFRLLLLFFLATLLSNLFAVFRARLVLCLVPLSFLTALLTHLLSVFGRRLLLFLFALETPLLSQLFATLRLFALRFLDVSHCWRCRMWRTNARTCIGRIGTFTQFRSPITSLRAAFYQGGALRRIAAFRWGNESPLSSSADRRAGVRILIASNHRTPDEIVRRNRYSTIPSAVVILKRRCNRNWFDLR